MSSWLRVCLSVAMLAGCTVRETHARCETAEDCGAGRECYLRYCVTSDLRAATATAAGVMAPVSRDAAVRLGAEPSGCAPVSTHGGDQEGVCCAAATSCYDGPQGTEGVGACRAGTRECTSAGLGACAGSVLPSQESCSNEGEDNDCDGRVDEISGRGAPCELTSGFGACGEGRMACSAGTQNLSCVRDGPVPAESCNYQDDDCDGQIDEGFDISTDPANCGTCGQRCNGDELCCGGACLAPGAADERGCPQCGAERPCADTALCCGGVCRDLQRDRRHCGACGHSCEQGQRCCEGACKSSCD